MLYVWNVNHNNKEKRNISTVVSLVRKQLCGCIKTAVKLYIYRSKIITYIYIYETHK